MALHESIGASPIGGGGGSGSGELLRLLAMRPAWWADAACQEHPEVTWFPEQGQPSEPAKAICAACLVQAECRAFADQDPDATRHGIWGGESAVQRKRARKAKRADVA